MTARNTATGSSDVQKWALQEISKSLQQLTPGHGHNANRRPGQHTAKSFEHVRHDHINGEAEHKHNGTTIASSSNARVHVQCCYAQCESPSIDGTANNVLIECSNYCRLRYHADGTDGTQTLPCFNRLTEFLFEHCAIRIACDEACPAQNCNGFITQISHCIGFDDRINDDDADDAEEEEEEGDADIDDIILFDLQHLTLPPSAFDIFDATRTDSRDNTTVVDAQWHALSQSGRRHYEQRARVLQSQWIAAKQAMHALDYCYSSGTGGEKAENPCVEAKRKSSNGGGSSPEAEPLDDHEKRKRLMAEQRQRRIEDMISQNPDIDDVELQHRHGQVDELQTLAAHKKGKKKKIKVKTKSKKSKKIKTKVSLSDLNDIADQWAANDKPSTLSPSSQQTSLSPSSIHTNVGAAPAKLQQWVSLAKQPKLSSVSPPASSAATPWMSSSLLLSTHTTTNNNNNNTHAVSSVSKPPVVPTQPPSEPVPEQIPSPSPSSSAAMACSWDKLKQGIASGDRIFAEIPCAPTCSPYLLVSTDKILQEWSDRLEEFHRWCTQFGQCRFLPISRSHSTAQSNRFVILEFSFVTHAKIAKEKLEQKLHAKIAGEIEFVQWRFGHAYFFWHSYVQLNDEILMTGNQFKRAEQVLHARHRPRDRDAPPPLPPLRPWQAFPQLALPGHYQSVSSVTSSSDEDDVDAIIHSDNDDDDAVDMDGDMDGDGEEEEQEVDDDDDDDEEEDDDDDDADDGDDDDDSSSYEVSDAEQSELDGLRNNKLLFEGRTLFRGDIVYLSQSQSQAQALQRTGQPLIIHNFDIGPASVQVLNYDNSLQTVEIRELTIALSFPSLHQDTQNETELRYRQSLLERLSERQLDYLLVCME